MSYWCRWCWWPLLAKLHVSKVMFPMTSTLRSPNWFTVFDSFVRLQSSKKIRLKKRTSSEAFNLFFRLQKCSSYVSVYVWLYVTTKAWHCVVSPKKRTNLLRICGCIRVCLWGHVLSLSQASKISCFTAKQHQRHPLRRQQQQPWMMTSTLSPSRSFILNGNNIGWEQWAYSFDRMVRMC